MSYYLAFNSKIFTFIWQLLADRSTKTNNNWSEKKVNVHIWQVTNELMLNSHCFQWKTNYIVFVFVTLTRVTCRVSHNVSFVYIKLRNYCILYFLFFIIEFFIFPGKSPPSQFNLIFTVQSLKAMLQLKSYAFDKYCYAETGELI